MRPVYTFHLDYDKYSTFAGYDTLCGLFVKSKDTSAVGLVRINTYPAVNKLPSTKVFCPICRALYPCYKLDQAKV